MSFQREIINWYEINKRDLPWRNTKSAYVIWLSEIILQQTRVEQGLPYFNKFLANFPTISDFAAAKEDKVLKLWQGLGYYSRGRNMLFTAKEIMDKYAGVFPVKYTELIQLKGIGDYTAAAISSFAANETRAVLDGNVFRVLARYFGIDVAINSTKGKKQFEALAQSLIEGQHAALYNQAIMEFGALQCKPKSPICGTCPLVQTCYAYNQGQLNNLPVKLKKVKVRERWFNYFIALKDDRILMKQRVAGDIWEKLYDFPLIESAAKQNDTDPGFLTAVKNSFGDEVKITPLSEKRHVLTHQIIYVQFFALENYMINFNLETEIKSVLLAEFNALPHPKVISNFIETHLKN
ncbi:MAG: A/G-specific adenine glycosylase [Bacteroidota bacterium]